MTTRPVAAMTESVGAIRDPAGWLARRTFHQRWGETDIEELDQLALWEELGRLLSAADQQVPRGDDVARQIVCEGHGDADAEGYARATADAMLRYRHSQIAAGRPCPGCYGHRHGRRCADCWCCATDAGREQLPEGRHVG